MTFAEHGYHGELKNGQKNGYGKLTCENGDIYEGTFVEDMQQGTGVFTYANGYKYDGEFLKGKWNGRGKFTFADGGYYKGDFREGKFHGQGSFVFAHGDCYDGEVSANMRHGEGTYWFANGNSYKGHFVKNKMTEGLFVECCPQLARGGEVNTRSDGTGTGTGTGTADEGQIVRRSVSYQAVFDDHVENVVTFTPLINGNNQNQNQNSSHSEGDRMLQSSCLTEARRPTESLLNNDHIVNMGEGSGPPAAGVYSVTIPPSPVHGTLVDGMFSPS